MSTTPASASSVVEGELLWTPSSEFARDFQLARFERWLGERRNLHFADYETMWRWSVTDLDAYGTAFWEYFRIISSSPYSSVHVGDMPKTRLVLGSAP